MTPRKYGFSFDDKGWCNGARQVRSPNHDARPAGIEPNLLVIHNISLPPNQYGGPWIIELFTNSLDYGAHPYFDQLRDLRVSAHFLIRRNGELIQFVSANDRAWHAGRSIYDGRENCNDFSIGIELEGSDSDPFEISQYDTLARIVAALQQHYPLSDVTGHQHIAPTRKTDPGPFFDWKRFRAILAARSSGAAAALRFPQN